MVFGLFTTTPPATEWQQCTIAGKVYSVQIRRRGNARRLTMRVRDRSIHVTVPSGTSMADITRFLNGNITWIDSQLKQQQAVIDNTIPESDHPAIYFHGRPMAVRLYRDPSHLGQGQIELTETALIIRVSAESRIRPARVLENWLKRQAREAIKAELDELLPVLGEKPVPLAIRDQKTRWGSCSTTRRLSFNWRLIMAPPESLRYLVIHEAAHLVHHDHSDRFWGLVEELMPDFRQHQNWLRKNQVALFADIDHRLAGLRPEA